MGLRAILAVLALGFAFGARAGEDAAATGDWRLVFEETFDAPEAFSAWTNIAPGATLAPDGGKTGGAARFVNDDMKKSVTISRALDPKLVQGRLRVVAVVRGQDLAQGEKPWHGSKVMLPWVAGENKQYPEVKRSYGTFDWQEQTTEFTVPATVQTIALQVGVQQATGTFLVDAIRVYRRGGKELDEQYARSLAASKPAAPTAFPQEAAPYLPDPLPARRAETVAPADIAFTVDGAAVRHGDFIARRTLNGVWKCSGLEGSVAPFPADDPAKVPAYAAPDFDDSGWDDFAVPQDWYAQYPKFRTDKQPYVRGSFRTRFMLDPEKDLAGGRRVVLRFENVNYDARLYVNGQFAGRHEGEFVPFEFDVTPFAKPGENVLAVHVLTDFGSIRGDRSRPSSRVYGAQWSLGTFKGGIYHSVGLRSEPAIAVRELLVTPRVAGKTAEVDYRIVNHRNAPVAAELFGLVTSAMKTDANAPAGKPVRVKVTLQPGVNTGTLNLVLDNPTLWDLGKPHLYHANLAVLDNGRAASVGGARFGMREMTVKDGHFHLNGRRVFLYGESSPTNHWSGRRGRTVEDEEKAIEKELLDFYANGVTMVRTPHAPTQARFLDIADEIGIMVLHEWGWSFTANLAPDFGDVNEREIDGFVRFSYNHPSVTVWSLGNEVKCTTPDYVKEFDRQYAFVRKMDKSGRPISTFSGSSGPGFCSYTLQTDVLSYHNYVGLGVYWPTAVNTMKQHMPWLKERYAAADGRLHRPVIMGETVGYSWGFIRDNKFRPGDVDAYAAYAARPHNWGQPNGIGFAGYIGLARALSPGGDQYARGLMGRRVLGLLRLDGQLDGYFPWFHSPGLALARLWNQPVYPALLGSDSLFARNRFTGADARQNAEPATIAVSNNTGAELAGLTLRLELAMPGKPVVPVGKPISLPPVPAWGQLRHPGPQGLPADLPAGHGQLRLTLVGADGKDVGRNYQDVYLQAAERPFAPVKAVRAVQVVDAVGAKNLEATRAALADHGIAHTVIAKWEDFKAPGLLVVPATHLEPTTLDIPEATLQRLHRDGGILLALEQRGTASVLPGTDALASDTTPFVDVVVPDHPILAGLDGRNLEAWNNPRGDGAVVRRYLSPFTPNAVLAKGPHVSRHGTVGAAMNESVHGKGRIILCQLALLDAYRRDSSAADVLYNLLSYAAGAEKLWSGARPLTVTEPDRYAVDPASLVPIDLKPYVNRSFTDKAENDGEGGWTDEGDNDYRNVPLGRQVVGGVAFDIIDPAKNDDRSCLVLRGRTRPAFPAAAKGIKVDGVFNRLFFLHAAAWVGGGEAMRYRIHYADGTSVDFPVVCRREVGDWWHPSRIPGAIPGLIVTNAKTDSVGLFAAEWVNPHPAKRIATLDVLTVGAAKAGDGDIDWVPEASPVPIVVAVTGEKPVEKPLSMTGKAFRRVSGRFESGGTVAPAVEASEPADRDAADRVVTIRFPATPAGEQPVAFLFFDPTPPRTDYRYLSFKAKTDKPARLRLRLAEKDWKGAYAGMASLRPGPEGGWREYRLELGKDLRPSEGALTPADLRGELLFNYMPEDEARPAVTISLTEVMLR